MTKPQRHVAYILMLHELQRNPVFQEKGAGCCWVWNELNGNVSHYGLPNRLPELYAKRTNTSAFWFRSKKERLSALKECIKETA